MAIIPSTQKFHTVSAEVDTENKGSETANSRREAFTMQDIVDTAGAGIPSLFEEGSFPGPSGQETSTQRVGSSNEATKVYATVSGGDSNTAAGSYATVGGGQGNTASNNSSPGGSTVGGGVNNIASGLSSTVAGGNGNSALGSRAVVGGGIGNIASGSSSATVGGLSNTATGSATFVGGGVRNDATADDSSVLGGRENDTLTFVNSHIIGSNLESDRQDCTFVENLSIKSIPTAATGLPSGSIWSNAGVLNIVP